VYYNNNDDDDDNNTNEEQQYKPCVEGVQALADILLCCHSNETCAPIANPPNNAQLEGTPYHSPSYIRVRTVAWECGEGHTDT